MGASFVEPFLLVLDGNQRTITFLGGSKKDRHKSVLGLLPSQNGSQKELVP